MAKTFEELEVGKSYAKVSHQFGNAKNTVTCISDDYTGLNRDIKYFCFTDRISKVPTQKEFIAALKDEATTLPKNYTQKQYDKACRSLEIRRHTFALWKFEMDGNSPSVSFFRTAR